jgi:hypothetical protein
MATPTSAIRKELAELAKSASAPVMDEVRKALPEIERALAAGATYAQVCETFARNGVALPVSTLRTYLYRLRQAAAAPAPERTPARRAKR